MRDGSSWDQAAWVTAEGTGEYADELPESSASLTNYLPINSRVVIEEILSRIDVVTIPH